MPKRGERATPAQQAALKAGQAVKAKRLAKAKQANPGEESQKERWARLLDGTLTVADLTDEEVEKSRVHGKAGMFHGEAPRLPSHLVAAFHHEQIKRAKSLLSSDLRKAAEVLGKIIDDPEASNSDKFKAAKELLDRGLGKTPETVNVKQVDPWADLIQAGGTFDDVRDLSGLTAEPVDADDDA